MFRRPRALSRTALATATVLAATTGLTVTTTGLALADDPVPVPSTDGVVIPDPGRFRPRNDYVFSAGATGFLHRPEGGELVWTDYATGADTPRGSTTNTAHSGLEAAVHTWPSGRTAVITDIAAGASVSVSVPAEQEWTTAFNADTILTSAKAADGRITGLFLRKSADGVVTERPVTGLGEATKLWIDAQDTRGALVTTQAVTGGPYTSYLLDYDTATLTRTLGTHAVSASLGADRIVVSRSYNDVLTVRRDDPTATPVVTPLPPVAPNEAGWGWHTVIGDWVLTHRELNKAPNGAVGGKLYAVPLGGGTARELLPAALERLTVAPDGSVLARGGSGADDWALHRVTLDDSGAPKLTKLRDLPRMPATYSGLDIAAGRVNYLADSGPKNGLYEVDTAAPGDVRRRAEPFSAEGLRSLGDGQSAFLYGSSVISPAGTGTQRQVDFPPTTRLTDASGRFVIAEHEDQQYVGDLGERPGAEAKVLLTRARTAAAVWGTTLWKPATTPGKINRYDLLGKWTSTDLDLRTGCTPTELQVVHKWIYWACGPEGKAGVFNQWGAMNVPVPVGEAVLGDGFLVRRDNAAGKLLLTDAATGRTTDLADVPVISAGSGRWKDWAVDKYGGGVAYVDAQRNIHVVPTGVAPQPPSVTYTTADGLFDAAAAQDRTWDALWRLSRPVEQWKVEIRDRYSRQLVRTLTGTDGPAATVTARWDGKDDEGRGVPASRYTYSLKAAPWAGDAFVDVTYGEFEARNTVLTTLPGSYLPLRPQRVLDTRIGLGAPQRKTGPWGNVTLQVGGVGGVPDTGVTNVVLNVTVTNPTKPGDLKVTPPGATSLSSQLNFTAGQTTSNLVVVPVVDGKVKIFVNTAGTTDLVADVAGYYTPGTTGSAYRPLTPTRFMDTRNGTGVPRAKVGSGGTARLQVTGVKGVPADGVTAVVMNVTATNASNSTFVTAYPNGTPRPGTSNLNVPAGRTVAGLVVVPVVDGKIAFTNNYGSIDLVGDVVGYYTSGTGAAFTGAESRRLMDTRSGLRVRKGVVGAGQSVTLPVAGVGAVPAGIKAVVLNVTATQPTTAGFVSVHPSGTQRTSASSLNFRAGQTVPNQVVVPVVDGKVTFYNHSGNVHLIADVEGWFA